MAYRIVIGGLSPGLSLILPSVCVCTMDTTSVMATRDSRYSRLQLGGLDVSWRLTSIGEVSWKFPLSWPVRLATWQDVLGLRTLYTEAVSTILLLLKK